MIPSTDPQWHVVYTLPKSERKVASKIEAMGIESYLPLYKEMRQWSDRKKKVELPLFPNYVFVKVNAMRRISLFSIKELVTFVSIEKKPVVIMEKEIAAIKKVLSEESDISSEEYFQEGMSVKIGYGQFAGLEGIVVRRSGKTRLVIKVGGLMKAFSFNISIKFIEALQQSAFQ